MKGGGGERVKVVGPVTTDLPQCRPPPPPFLKPSLFQCLLEWLVSLCVCSRPQAGRGAGRSGAAGYVRITLDTQYFPVSQLLLPRGWGGWFTNVTHAPAALTVPFSPLGGENPKNRSIDRPSLELLTQVCEEVENTIKISSP